MRTALAIIMLISAVGCDATLQRFRNSAVPPAEQYRIKAMDFEQASEPRKAVLAWRIAGRLDSSDPTIAENISRIEKHIGRVTKDYYNNGLDLYQKGRAAEARRAFLKVLRLDPGHKQALYYLKRGLPHALDSVYKVRAGDSFTKIAAATYHDPQKAYAVAYFNDLDPRKPLRIGTVLILPDLDSKYLYPRSDIEAYLAAAREAFAQKKHVRATSLALKIIEAIPGHAQARQLVEASRFEHGMALKAQGRYLAALEQLKLMKTNHKDRRQAMAEIRRLISQQSQDKKMTVARSLMSRGNLEGAISMTEEILADNPDNALARALLNEAGYLLGKALIDQGREGQAIVWLEKVDPDYSDTAIQLSLARSRTKSAAEEHYRSGVKHFINEDLESAIKDWQQALGLNPDHPKARQDMENALRLLEKWRELDKTPSEGSPND